MLGIRNLLPKPEFASTQCQNSGHTIDLSRAVVEKRSENGPANLDEPAHRAVPMIVVRQTSRRLDASAQDPSRKPKVMFIINSLCGGGAERVMSTLLDHSAAMSEKYDISLTLLDEEKMAFPPPEWVNVHRLDCRFGLWASLSRLRALIRAEKPDITLSFLTRSNVANAVAMAGSGRPWLISERINTSRQLGHGPRALANKLLVGLTYRRATSIIAVSKGVAQDLNLKFRVPSDKIRVIPNPVDLAAIRSSAEGTNPFASKRPYILALGRLVQKKNFALLLSAYAKSRFSGHLIIAGDGPKRAELSALAQELGLGDRVSFPGFLANPFPALAGAHLFALSSNAEGFPNALVEALSLGIPVVATNCRDGPAEILAGKMVDQIKGCEIAEAGILTPTDDVDAYVKALGSALNPRIRKEIIGNGLTRVEGYSLSASVASYWAAIEQALGLETT